MKKIILICLFSIIALTSFADEKMTIQDVAEEFKIEISKEDADIEIDMNNKRVFSYVWGLILGQDIAKSIPKESDFLIISDVMRGINDVFPKLQKENIIYKFKKSPE